MNKIVTDLSALGILEGAGRVGQIVLANEAAFNKSYMSEPLTEYACGWKTQDSELETLLEFLAPGVRVPHRFEYRKANNADEFAMIADDGDVRALYGEFKLVKSLGDVIDAHTVSKGLTTVIEKDTEMPGDREAKVAWLKRMCLKAEIYRAIVALTAAATNTGKTWGSSAQPDIDVMSAIDAFGDAVGINANRILFGTTAWMKRIGAYAAQTKANIVPPMTMKDLAGFLAVQEVMGSNVRYTSGSGKNKLVTANTVFVFQGEKGASQDDPSPLKRFWSPEVAGGEWTVYVNETNAKLVYITVAHTSNICTTCSTGVQTLTIS